MQKNKNILLIKTVSRYGSLNRYIEEWALAMRKYGCNTCVLDAWSLAEPTLFNHVISTYKFDAIIDINGVLISWGLPQNLPPEVIYGTYLCDPPSSFKSLYAQSDERTIIFACDKNFCDYISHFFPTVKHTAFVPLSGSLYPEYVPYEDRKIDIIFTGTYTHPDTYKNELFSQFEAGGTLAIFAKDMLEDIIANPQYTLPECLTRILKKYNVSVTDAEFDELVEDFINVDFYARFYYRDKVIRTLLAAGLKIHVFGNGWENFCSEYNHNMIIHKGGPYAASKALANAKISLNVMPWFKNAFQERIASAMLSKVVAVTDESKYITDHFDNNKNLLIYSLTDIDPLADRIKYLLEHPQAAKEIAENGYKESQVHTWDSRVYDMLRELENTFHASFIRNEEGKELEFEIEYPDKQTLTLDAIYELNKMSILATTDIGQIEHISPMDIHDLLKNFDNFQRQFSKHLEGLEMNSFIEHCLLHSDRSAIKHIPGLFSMQCKALMGNLLLSMTNLKL